ncbi:MAG: hypothetical protein ACRD0G_03395, partial [Acidimicrobiales bacterium]
SDESSTTTETPETEPEVDPTDGTPADVLCSLPSGRCASITDIQIVDGAYHVLYDTEGFEADIQGAHHIHFFFDNVAAIDAGTNEPGAENSNWILYDEPVPFTGFNTDDPRAEGAGQMCALVADQGHAIELNTGNCFALPDA